MIDDDIVELSNLQRQVLFRSDQLGRPKVDCAVEAAAALNPEVEVRPYQRRLDADNAGGIIADYDLVADGSDNFATRYVLNDACFFAREPLVGAALLRFDGQLSTYKAYEDGNHPCYRCLFAEAPPAGVVPRCEEAGIFGAIAGIMGSLQATEVLKEVLEHDVIRLNSFCFSPGVASREGNGRRAMQRIGQGRFARGRRPGGNPAGRALLAAGFVARHSICVGMSSLLAPARRPKSLRQNGST